MKANPHRIQAATKPDRILLINYDFPPNLAGVRRLVKFTQYLPDHNFEPLVLCATPSDSRNLDFDALSLVPNGTPVYRTPSPDLDHLKNSRLALRAALTSVRQRFDLQAPAATQSSTVAVPPSRLGNKAAAFLRNCLALPDDRLPWLLTATPMASHLLKSQAIRYVFTSSYPHSTHLIGLYLKERFRIHWHADFRDGWTQNPYYSDYLTPAHKRFNHWLEEKVVRTADTVTAVSQPIVDHLSTLAPPRKVSLLPNGFDPLDLENIPTETFDRFTLAYTGTMFMQRSPDSFFAAVRGLLDDYPGLADNFQVLFRSNMKAEHQAMIHDLGLTDVIKNLGMGNWAEALSLQKSADALLVLEGESPNSHIMLTQKIFEYLAATKPVLAVCPEGALANLVRSTRAGIVVNPDNVFRLKETLFELFLGRLNFNRDTALINTYTRQNQARQLATILRSKPIA